MASRTPEHFKIRPKTFLSFLFTQTLPYRKLQTSPASPMEETPESIPSSPLPPPLPPSPLPSPLPPSPLPPPLPSRVACEASDDWLDTQTATLEDFQESSLAGEKLVEEGEESKEGKVFEVDVGYYFETEQLFSSKESLVEWVRGVGRSLGFVVTVKGSDKLTGRLTPRVFLGCDRGGKYRDNQNRKDFVKKKCRKSSSKWCGCSFAIKGQKVANVDEWKLVVLCGKHNHEMVHLEGHAYAGRLNENEEKLVEQMYSSGVKPRKILAAVKRNSETNTTTIRTIYNEREKLHKKELDGATPVQFLYRCITKEGYVVITKLI